MKYYRFNIKVGVWVSDNKTLKDAKEKMIGIIYEGGDSMNFDDEDLELIDVEKEVGTGFCNMILEKFRREEKNIQETIGVKKK